MQGIGKGARGTAIVEVSAAREGVVFGPGMSWSASAIIGDRNLPKHCYLSQLQAIPGRCCLLLTILELLSVLQETDSIAF